MAQGTPALHGVDDRTVACRGDHHDWPILKPGPLPRGVSAVPQHDGCFQVTITCKNCGRWRRKTTLPGGGYDTSAVYAYGGGPKDFSAKEDSQRGGLTRTDYTIELWRRMAEFFEVTRARAVAS
jgi:hypothetical protein